MRALAALESGEVDIVDRLPRPHIDRLNANEHYIVTTYSLPGHSHSLIFNLAKAPTKERAVRQAIARAIDIDIMQDIVYDGLGIKACSAPTSTMLGHSDAFCQTQTPTTRTRQPPSWTQAGWLLDPETGIRERNDLPLTIEHWSPDDPLNAVTAYFIAEDMAALGIDFQINLVDNDAYAAAVRRGRLPYATLMGHI